MSVTLRRQPRLRIDPLESRSLLSVVLNGTVVEVTGTIANDEYRCYLSNDKLYVEEGPAGAATVHEYDIAGSQPVTRVVADLRNGADRFITTPNVLVPIFASGGDGSDTLVGGNGADRLDGGNQSDALNGVAGNDTLIGGNQGDILGGAVGDDEIDGGDGNDTITGGTGNDTIEGFRGADRIHGDDGDDVIFGNIDADRIWGDQGYDFIDGGDDSNDWIWGGTENDTLFGSGGNDRVYGEQGTDTLNGGQGNDVLDGGTEDDLLDGSTGRDSLTGGEGNDVLKGGDGRDTLAGNAGNDLLTGNDQADDLSGGAGWDTLRGAEGNDTLRGGADEDWVYGDNGRDRLRGDGQDDHLYGGQGADRLDGGGGDDTLVSIDDAASDTLVGGTGKDSFWADQSGGLRDTINAPSADEAETNVHYVAAFENGADKRLDGDSIPDPAGGTASEDFSDQPLFSKFGPQVFDVQQQDLGDCWLMASLAAAVRVEPNVARQLVVDLGDGTYAVHLEESVLNTDAYYRVDGDLPVDPTDTTNPQFAGLGVGRSLWVAIVEKAYALDRGNYQALNGDDAWTALGQIGGINRVGHLSVADAFRDFVNLGVGGVWCTQGDQADVDDTVAGHCYAITNVTLDRNGDPKTIELYNPWGVDGIPVWDSSGNFVDYSGDDGEDDGFITLTLQQAQDDSFNPFGAVTADFSAFG